MTGITAGGQLMCSTPTGGGPSIVTVSIDDATVMESAGQMAFTIRLSAPSSSPVTVEYSTVPVTTAAFDFVALPLSVLTFAPGETSQLVLVQILNDVVPEYTETFNLHLANPTNAILADNIGVGTIVDDEQGVDVVLAVPGGVLLLRGNGSAAFGAPAFFATGTDPMGLAVGDLNNDGNADLVTANFDGYPANGDVSVLLGTGAGTFGAPVKFAAGQIPSGVAVRDVNGDGKLDVVTANFGSHDISVLLGAGDGTLGTAVSFTTLTAGFQGGFPMSIVMGDVNGDARADAVTVSTDSNHISVLLGRADGTFGTPAVFFSDSLVSAVLEDLNGDGKLDVVTANGELNRVSVLMGNGDGTFAVPVYSSTVTANGFAGSRPYAVAVGDFTGDGKLDVVTANTNSAVFGDASLLPGNGDGTLGEAQLNQVFGASGAFAIVAVDLFGSGNKDIVLANVNSRNISVLANFGFLQPYGNFPAGAMRAMAVGEFK